MRGFMKLSLRKKTIMALTLVLALNQATPAHAGFFNAFKSVTDKFLCWPSSKTMLQVLAGGSIVALGGFYAWRYFNNDDADQKRNKTTKPAHHVVLVADKPTKPKNSVPDLPQQKVSVRANGHYIVGRSDEDRRVIKTFDDGSMVAVIADGHGGKYVADQTIALLPDMVKESITANAENLKEAFTTTLKNLHDRLNFVDSEKTGACVAVVYVSPPDKDYVCIATLGDSRVVYGTKNRTVHGTTDHKASDPMEQKRIKDAGGSVQNNRVSGKLAVSRALGDKSLSPYVIQEPDFKMVKKNDLSCIVMASDGVWDVFNSPQALALTHNSLLENPSTGNEAKVLAEEAQIRYKDWLQKQGYDESGIDDITTIVMKFE